MNVVPVIHAPTAIQIARHTLQRRGVPILGISRVGPVPTLAVDDFANRTGREWIRYAWGTDESGRRWEKHVTTLAHCRLTRILRVLPVPHARRSS